MNLTTNEASSILYQSCFNFSQVGACELIEWMEEIENECGITLELDVVSLRCEYAEYGSAMEAANEYKWEPIEGEFDSANEAAALAWLEDRTQVRVFPKGILIAQF